MQSKTILSLLICAFIISIVGSIIFPLTSALNSYLLFCIFFLLTATIILVILRKIPNKQIKLRYKIKLNNIKLHVLLVLLSISLLVLQLTKINIQILNVVLYVIVFIFGLGFFFLNILKFEHTSRIEYASLAYPISVALIAIFGTIALLMPSNLRGIFAVSLVTLLSIISLFRVRTCKQNRLSQSLKFFISYNDLILVAVLLFAVCFFIILYPQITNLRGLDIARNYLNALGSTKNSLGNFYYPNTNYPIFGIYQSYLIYIVNPSVALFQTASVLLNILALLAFYAMAKQYLKQYSGYLPAIATLIWAFFAGFGWLSFVALRLENTNTPIIALISQANSCSYGDITWRRSFFYLSMETSLVLVFALFYFLKRPDLSKAKQIIFMTVLMTPLPLMHPYATYILLPFLIILTIFQSRKLGEQTKSAAYALIIAGFISLLLNYLLNIQYAAITLDYVTFLGYVLTSLSIITILSLRTITPNIMKVSIKKILNSKYTVFVAIMVLLLYFASLFLWLGGNLNFDFVDLSRFGNVPWCLYPVKLGLLGILGIITVVMFLTNPRYRSREIGVMIVLVLVLILASRVMSSLQVQYASTFTFDPNSWLSESIRRNILSFREERMFELFKIPLAIGASIALSRCVLTKTKQNKKTANYIIVTGLVSLIVISGMASTFSGFEYYTDLIQANPLSESELNIINNMQNNIYTNGKAIIIAPQTQSSYTDFTGAISIITESTAAWLSKSPELPLFVTRYSQTTPTYIYLHKIRDYQKLPDYAGNYLEHISNVTQLCLENDEVQIKEINNTSIPASDSTTALIIPYDSSTMSLVEPSYQEEAKQYTIASLFFQETLHSLNFYNTPISYTNVQISESAIFSGSNSYIRINGTKTNSGKLLVEFTFQTLDITRNQVIASKFDWGTPSQKSWEIVQYGQKLVFKLSSDGQTEVALSTGNILQLGKEYTVKCEYDGVSMTIVVNNHVLATRLYDKGIFQSNTDLIIAAELNNNNPTGYANMLLKYIRVLNDVPAESTSIFYSYDLLSLTGLNYTTVLSGDENLNEYRTLVLPYDDITNQNLITEIENYAKSNVRYVVIINTNGYGPLLSIFGNKTSETFVVDKTLVERYFGMQTQIEVPQINLNSGVTALAHYANTASSSPFVMETTQGQVTLIYVNIYPLLSQNQLFDPAPTNTLAKTLNNYIDLYDQTTVTSWFAEPSLLFTEFQANGTISVSSNSIASISLPENQTLNINSGNSVLIESADITVQGGYGFYTTLTALNPTVTLQGDQSTSVSIRGNVTFILRQPEISVNGNIQFENFYMLHPPTIYTDGRTTTLSGNITLNIYVSDEYSIALPYKLNSPITVTYEKPLMDFDETQSIIQLIPYVLLIAVFAIPILLIQRSKTIDSQDNQKEQTN